MATAVQQSSTTTFSFAKFRAALRGSRLPSLVEHLKADGFTLTPNHARPLSNRVIARRLNPDTGQMFDVTEREYVERIYWQRPGGHHLTQVWTFENDGVVLQVNDAFNGWTRHHGLRQRRLRL